MTNTGQRHCWVHPAHYGTLDDPAVQYCCRRKWFSLFHLLPPMKEGLVVFWGNSNFIQNPLKLSTPRSCVLVYNSGSDWRWWWVSLNFSSVNSASLLSETSHSLHIEAVSSPPPFLLLFENLLSGGLCSPAARPL